MLHRIRSANAAEEAALASTWRLCEHDGRVDAVRAGEPPKGRGLVRGERPEGEEVPHIHTGPRDLTAGVAAWGRQRQTPTT